MKTRFLLPVVMLAVSAPCVLQAQLDTLWLRRYDGGVRDEDYLSDMHVDSLGNVYICGTGYTDVNGWNIEVRKYGPSGESLWAVSWDGPAHNDDSAAALAVDAAGNVYVCGWTMDSVSRMSIVTQRYNANGALAWSKVLKRGNGDAGALAICLNRSDRVTVAGYIGDSTAWNLDYCVTSYDASTGDTAWVRYYNRTPENDEDAAVSICRDDSGNVYVTGFSYDDATDYDIVTIRYTPAGVQTWMKRFNNRPWVGDDYGTKVVFNPVTRGVLVTGAVYDDDQDYNYFTIHYRSTNGDSIWAREYNRYPSNMDDWPVSLTTDRWGRIYVTGFSYDDVVDYDMTTVAYSPTGSPRWVAREDGGGGEDGGNCVVTDSLGNVLVAGYLYQTETDWDAAVVKYDSFGTRSWYYTWDNPTSRNEDWGVRLAPQRSGSLVLGATSFDNVSDYDQLTMRLRELTHDFAVELLPLPESLWFTDTLRPVAVVRNLAISADSGWVRLTLSPTSRRDSAWVSLGVNRRDTIRFRPWMPDTVVTVLAKVWSSLPVDERRTNDTASASVVVYDDTTAIAGGAPGQVRLGVAVVPNPLRGVGALKYWVRPGAPAMLRLYDASGALVSGVDGCVAVQSGSGNGTLRLDVSRLASGVYFLKLVQDREVARQKLVVQR